MPIGAISLPVVISTERSRQSPLIGPRSDPERSIDIIKRAWSGPLDSAIHPAEKGFNSRLLIDACRPYEWMDRFPPAIGPEPAYKRETREKWGWILK